MGKISIKSQDRHFSKLVRQRARWKCECCGKQYEPNSSGLHCSHFFGRASRATRWMQDNAAAHCFYCHQKLGANPVLFRDWIVNRLGEERVNQLQRLHNTPIKLTKQDLADINADLRSQLKEQRLGEDFETPAVILLNVRDI
jgi:hypothetical protein